MDKTHDGTWCSKSRLSQEPLSCRTTRNGLALNSAQPLNLGIRTLPAWAREKSPDNRKSKPSNNSTRIRVMSGDTAWNGLALNSAQPLNLGMRTLYAWAGEKSPDNRKSKPPNNSTRTRMIMRDGVESSSLRLRPAAESDLASFRRLTKPRPRLVEQ